MSEKCKHEVLEIVWGDSSAWLSKGMTLRLEDGGYYIEEEDDDWELCSGGEAEEFLCDVRCTICGRVFLEDCSVYTADDQEDAILEQIRLAGAGG